MCKLRAVTSVLNLVSLTQERNTEACQDLPTWQIFSVVFRLGSRGEHDNTYETHCLHTLKPLNVFF